MRYLLILLIILGVSSCKKEETLYNVTFKVTSNTPSQSFIVRYTTPDGSTQSRGAFTGASWSSDAIPGYKKGMLVRFAIENSGGDFTQLIFVNSSLIKSANAGGGGTQEMTLTL